MKLPSWRHEDRAVAAAVETKPASAEPQAIRITMGQLRELSAVFAARGSQALILRLNKSPHSALVEV